MTSFAEFGIHPLPRQDIFPAREDTWSFLKASSEGITENSRGQAQDRREHMLENAKAVYKVPSFCYYK